MSRSERIAQQLGMSHGTAANRLRKMILFDLLRQLKKNICFKCQKEIMSEVELSIEHKQPWEGRDVSLFWNLDNISFSHLMCNRPHSYGRELQKKIGPEGTAWCYRHQKFLSVEEFHKDSSNWNGLQSLCKICRGVL